MLEASAPRKTASRPRYVHGYGMLVPGSKRRSSGSSAGDVRDIVVPADAGYDEYDVDSAPRA